MSKELKLSTQLFAKQILITNNNLQAKCQEFINQLWESYSAYQTSLDKEQEEWKKVLEAKTTVFIEPEKLTTRSPLTILDAPWGSGKTYFIEHLAKLFALSEETTDSKKKKLNKKGFVNLVVIDTWKFINSDVIVFDVVKKIYLIICRLITKKNQNVSKKIWTKLAWLFCSFIPVALLVTNAALKLYFQDFPDFSGELLAINEAVQNKKKEKQKELDEIKYDQAIAEISEKLDPTIIVFDNVERMGKQAWEIIKTIQKLAVFANFVFVLPMNKNKLTFGQAVDQENHEAVIDKYLTLGIYFELKQDYFGLLKKLKLPSEYVEIVAEILNDEINGSKLSIRTLENALKTNYVIKRFKTNKYCGLQSLKRIWPSKKNDQLIFNDVQNFKKKIEEIDYGFLSNTENDYIWNNFSLWNDFKVNFEILISFNLIKEKSKKNYDQFAEFVESKNYFLNNFNDNLISKLNHYANYFEKELARELKEILDNQKEKLSETKKEINNRKIGTSQKKPFNQFEISNLNISSSSLKELIANPNYLIALVHRIKEFASLIDKKIKNYKTKKDQKLIWETAQNLFDKVRKTKIGSEEPLINDKFFEFLIEEIKDQACK